MKARIEPAENGPLLVKGLSHLSRIGSDAPYATRETMALCRCGKSGSKPFCDGTHAQAGFDDAKRPERTPDRRDAYVGGRLTIHDNRGICAHAGFCTDRHPEVFRLGEEPWIDPDGGSVEEVDAAVKACPSGAIAYSVDGVEQTPSDDGEPRILVAPGGPYAVKGDVELLGQEWGQGARRDCYDLCRCGDSKNKPFCDGSHWNSTFDAG